MKFAASAEQHRVVPTFGVGELDTIADGERPDCRHSCLACQQTRRERSAGLSEVAPRLRI